MNILSNSGLLAVLEQTLLHSQSTTSVLLEALLWLAARAAFIPIALPVLLLAVALHDERLVAAALLLR